MMRWNFPSISSSSQGGRFVGDVPPATLFVDQQANLFLFIAGTLTSGMVLSGRGLGDGASSISVSLKLDPLESHKKGPTWKQDLSLRHTHWHTNTNTHTQILLSSLSDTHSSWGERVKCLIASSPALGIILQPLCCHALWTAGGWITGTDCRQKWLKQNAALVCDWSGMSYAFRVSSLLYLSAEKRQLWMIWASLEDQFSLARFFQRDLERN